MNTRTNINIPPPEEVQLRPQTEPGRTGQQSEKPERYVISCFGRSGTIMFNTFWMLIISTTYYLELSAVNTVGTAIAALTNITMVINFIFLTLNNFYISKGLNINGCLFKTMRVFMIFAMAGELTVFLFYWPAVAPGTIPNYEKNCVSPTWCYVYTIISHGFVLIPPWAFVLASYTDFTAGEFYYSLCFGVGYSFLVLVPYTLIAEPVYNIFTFNDVFSFLLLVGVWVLNVACYFIGLGIASCTRKRMQEAHDKERNKSYQ